ncbi:MAG: alanine dehydrogenase [Halanaerobiales bacterium]
MIIGIPEEIKNNENRVAVTPGGVKALVNAGHKVLIESGAGLGSGINDIEYKKVGAQLMEKTELFHKSDMIMKVKEPLPEEYNLFKKGQILFTYLHLAAEKKLTQALLNKEVTGIAYETIQKKDGSLPLLTPMSEVAGRLAAQEGAFFLEKPHGGIGKLLGGVPGVRPSKVVIVGGGTVGINAAKMASGLGADVTIMEIDASQMRYLDDIFQGRIKTLKSSRFNIRKELQEADLVIGAVLIPGAKAPHLITENMIKEMKEDSVVVDVSIDQGGCIETTHPTTHDDPVFKKYGVVHYSVANMPGAVPRTSTYALTNETISFALELAGKGLTRSLLDNPALLKGLNVYQGKITYKAVAETFDLEFHVPEKLLN